MALRVIYCNDIDPFSKDFLRCPYCGGRRFTSINHAMVVCDRCDCRFTVEPAAGEGCVVNASPPETGLYAERWECPCCGQEKVCMPGANSTLTCDNPGCDNHGLPLVEHPLVVDPGKLGLPAHYVMIVRETEISGWIHIDEKGFPARVNHPSEIWRNIKVTSSRGENVPVRVVRAR